MEAKHKEFGGKPGGRYRDTKVDDLARDPRIISSGPDCPHHCPILSPGPLHAVVIHALLVHN
jgi:hypothetical protein